MRKQFIPYIIIHIVILMAIQSCNPYYRYPIYYSQIYIPEKRGGNCIIASTPVGTIKGNSIIVNIPDTLISKLGNLNYGYKINLDSNFNLVNYELEMALINDTINSYYENYFKYNSEKRFISKPTDGEAIYREYFESIIKKLEFTRNPNPEFKEYDDYTSNFLYCNFINN